VSGTVVVVEPWTGKLATGDDAGVELQALAATAKAATTMRALTARRRLARPVSTLGRSQHQRAGLRFLQITIVLLVFGSDHRGTREVYAK